MLLANDAAREIALSRNGEIQILDPEGLELEKYDIPDGAEMKVEDGPLIARGPMLYEWDPHNVSILSEVGGKVRYEDIVEDETMRIEIDPSGHAHRTIVGHEGTFNRKPPPDPFRCGLEPRSIRPPPGVLEPPVNRGLIGAQSKARDAGYEIEIIKVMGGLGEPYPTHVNLAMAEL